MYRIDGQLGRTLETIEKIGGNVRALEQAIENKDWNGAADLIINDVLSYTGLEGGEMSNLARLVRLAGTLATVEQRARSNDLMGAGLGLLEAGRQLSSDAGLQARLLQASAELKRLEPVFSALESGDYAQAAGRLNEFLGDPLEISETVEEVRRIGVDAKAIDRAVRMGDLERAADLISRRLGDGAGSREIQDFLRMAAGLKRDLEQVGEQLGGEVMTEVNSALAAQEESRIPFMRLPAEQKLALLDELYQGMRKGTLDENSTVLLNIAAGKDWSTERWAKRLTVSGDRLEKVIREAAKEGNWQQIPGAVLEELGRYFKVEPAVIRDVERLTGMAAVAREAVMQEQTGIMYSAPVSGLSADNPVAAGEGSFDQQAGTWNAAQLGQLYLSLDAAGQAKLTEAINRHASPATREAFVDNTQRELLARSSELSGGGLTPEQKELLLDLTQLSLDITGLADPTPLSDGANGLISLFRGDFLGAGISAASMIPYIGDLAKVGKLGKWAQTVESTISMAAKNPEFAARVAPVLEKIRDGINAIPGAVFDKLPEGAQENLRMISSRIDELFQAGGTKLDEAAAGALNTIQRQVGNNRVEWITDAQGRLIEARAVLREHFSGLNRSKSEAEAQRRVAARGIEGDHGGHAVGHRFLGDQGEINLFPQNGVGVDGLKNFNGSAFKKVENEIADWIEAGAEVRYNVKFSDFDANGRPAGVKIEYIATKNGEEIYKNKEFFENAPGQTFERLSRAEIERRMAAAVQ